MPPAPKNPRRNRLRIIGGEWRSRVIRFADAPGLRPTPERARETVFNWLGQRLDGLACLDLFAGSGALGFEAASRGATSVVLVESSRAVAAALRQSAAALAAGERVRVVEGDALQFLRQPVGPFDVVFVDPPYDSGLLAPAFAALAGRLGRGGRVYFEHAAPQTAPPGWRITKHGRAGQVHFYLAEQEPELVNEPTVRPAVRGSDSSPLTVAHSLTPRLST